MYTSLNLLLDNVVFTEGWLRWTHQKLLDLYFQGNPCNLLSQHHRRQGDHSKLIDRTYLIQEVFNTACSLGWALVWPWGNYASGKMLSVKPRSVPVSIALSAWLSLLALKDMSTAEERPKPAPSSCESRWVLSPKWGGQVKCFGSAFQSAWAPLGKAKGPATSVSKYVKQSTNLLCNKCPTVHRWKML